jgi:hypothetical protein
MGTISLRVGVRSEAAATCALILLILGLAAAGPPRAHAGEWFFCPDRELIHQDWQWFTSGMTCTAGNYTDGDYSTSSQAYHHLDAVEMGASPAYSGLRTCANWRHTPTGDVVGDWKCGYSNPEIKYPGGDAGWGTVHDGDPSPFYGFGAEEF